MNGGWEKRLAKLERKRQPAGRNYHVFLDTRVKETRAQAIARHFPDGVPPGGQVVFLRWLTDEDPVPAQFERKPRRAD
jgi:hypothetical protein